MTLTVEYSEMTAKIVEHFKITATTNANWGIPARTQEEYKQKKKFSPRPHGHSHAFWHIRTLTHMTVSRHTYLYSSHTSWKEKHTHSHKKRIQFMHYAWRRRKKINVKQASTVKPVLSDHPTVQGKMVVIDRWSLEQGFPETDSFLEALLNSCRNVVVRTRSIYACQSGASGGLMR